MRVHADVVDRKNLTPRESEVFALLCSGLSDKAIAAELGIHLKTVSKHIDHVYEKLGIRWCSINRRCTAIGLAVTQGMVKLVLRSVIVVLIFQCAWLDDEAVVRPVARAGRVSFVRRG